MFEVTNPMSSSTIATLRTRLGAEVRDELKEAEEKRKKIQEERRRAREEKEKSES